MDADAFSAPAPGSLAGLATGPLGEEATAYHPGPGQAWDRTSHPLAEPPDCDMDRGHRPSA